MIYDIIIVGGGPSGISCAIEAQKAGLNYLILEKGVLVNSIYHFPVNMTFFSTSKKLEIGDVPFISHQDKPTRQEALEYYRRLIEFYNLKIQFNSQVTHIEKEENVFLVQTEKDQIIHSKYVIVATGFYDNFRKLNVPGEELPKVKHYYDDVHHYVRQNVIVVGAANSACDVALECWQKGANVTMIVREKELYPKVKYWILPNIQNRIKDGDIKAYFNSNITDIRFNEVDIQTSQGCITLKNDYVLAMTGYHPDYSFFQSIGIKLNDNNVPSYNESTLETNISGLYMAGVVLSGDSTSQLFIENTRHHGKKIMDHIYTKKK